MSRPLFYLLLAVAFLLRLVLIPNPGFEADVSFWKSWGLAVADFGIVKALPLTNFNYPTPWGYVLAVMVTIYSFFADPHNFNEFWQNTNLLFLTIAKAVPILADFGIAAVFLYIGKHAKRLGFPPANYSLFSIIYLLSPLSLFDGALWGQVDSLGILLFLCAFLALLRHFSFLAGLIFMVAMMTKLQNMIYGPIFFLFVFQLTGPTGLARAAAGALTGFFGLNIEFFLAQNGSRVFESITGNYDYFPWLSLNAYNPWWIFSGAKGMQFSDKIAAIGIVNAKTVGLMTFSSMYLFTVLRQLVQFVKLDKFGLKTFLESLILVNASFFLFQTQSHDRYAFPLSVFLLLWLPFVKNIKLFTIFYSLFTGIYFYNLHNALIVNYPDNGIPFMSALNIPFLTLLASWANIALFCVFLISLIRSSRTTIYYLLFTLMLLIAALVFLNKPLWSKKPISLTKLTPISATAGYASRQVNMPANAAFGFPKWGYLSVQYAFYKTGIGTHAPAKEVYDINKKFKKFTTDYGVDTNGGPQGSVVFEVWGDGKKLFASDVIKRFDLPRHADVDITGVKMLELIITDANDGNTDDHADWLDTLLFP